MSEQKMREAFRGAFHAAALKGVDYDAAVEAGLAAALAEQPAPCDAIWPTGDEADRTHYAILATWRQEVAQAVEWLEESRMSGLQSAARNKLRRLLKTAPAPAVPDDVVKDAARFRWLLEDHADPETRVVVKTLLVSMRTRSLSGARLDIDAAMLAAAPEVPRG